MDDIVPPVWRQSILTGNLSMATILRAGASPEVNMRYPIFPVANTLRAGVFESEVFLGVWIPYDFTLVELARCCCHREWVVIGAFTTRGVTTTTVVGNSRAWWIVVWV